MKCPFLSIYGLKQQFAGKMLTKYMKKKINQSTAKAGKKINRKTLVKPKKSKKALFTFGGINPAHGRILVLFVSIIFILSYLIVSSMTKEDENKPSTSAPIQFKKSTSLEREIAQLVHGYPIEKMTPYIFEQDPKTAMFLVAIAKKESAWGKRKPVLDGKDCYNYWGFRLKTDRMGSGGHTCFDSPKQAVDIVAERIDQMIQDEDIDTPNDMIVWKCGYGCQDKPKTLSEKKWINDVDFYYSAMNEYL